MKTKIILASLILLSSIAVEMNAQTLIHHTTNWFGPNANPVPEFTGAVLPSHTTISLAADHSFGYGDETQTLYVSAEIPIIPQKASVKIWMPAMEHYQVSDEVYEKRQMLEEKSGVAVGDLYFQTRIKLWEESDYRPAVVFNATLKTASGSSFKNRRFFNTAGYYFDVEIGKSFIKPNAFIKEIRVSGDLGFFSWDVQTPGLNVQDDAFMYGGKILLKSGHFGWENTISGYYGWLRRIPDYGNKPLVLSTRLNYYRKKQIYFLQYLHGVQHFPYEQIRIGTSFNLASLTPRLGR